MSKKHQDLAAKRRAGFKDASLHGRDENNSRAEAPIEGKHALRFTKSYSAKDLERE